MSDGMHIIYWRDKCKKLEKTLDKACAKLEEFDCLYGELQQANEWKEWCLKDVD